VKKYSSNIRTESKLQTMHLSGTIGSTSAVATFKDNNFKLVQKKETLLNSIDFICFQRTGTGTKTIDVVWICSNNVYQQTIDTKEMHQVVKHLSELPIFDIGPDPGKWSKWKKKAIDEQWSHLHWEQFLSSIAVQECDSEDEEDEIDDEWKPCSDDEESEDDEDSEAEADDEESEAEEAEESEESEAEESEAEEAEESEAEAEESEAEEAEEAEEEEAEESEAGPAKRIKLST